MSHISKPLQRETDILSVLPEFYEPKERPDLESPIPTAEDPSILVATFKTQAKILEIFESRGAIDGNGRNLEAQLKDAIADLEVILKSEDTK